MKHRAHIPSGNVGFNLIEWSNCQLLKRIFVKERIVIVTVTPRPDRLLLFNLTSINGSLVSMSIPAAQGPGSVIGTGQGAAAELGSVSAFELLSPLTSLDLKTLRILLETAGPQLEVFVVSHFPFVVDIPAFTITHKFNHSTNIIKTRSIHNYLFLSDP